MNEANQVSKNWNFDGAKYAVASSHQKEWGRSIMAELNLSGAEKILDLGCGDGLLSAQLADLVPSGAVLGIDAAPGMIDFARRYERDNLTFALLDIDQLAFESEFDVIFSNATLHWVKDHRCLLLNCYRALRNGGIIRFNFGGTGNCAHFIKTVRQVIADPDYAPIFKDFSWPWYMPGVDEYESLLQDFPFRNVRVWEENKDRSFPSRDEIVKWIDQPSIVPFLDHLPQELQRGFRDRVVANTLRETVRDDGTYFETFRRLNVFAQK